MIFNVSPSIIAGPLTTAYEYSTSSKISLSVGNAYSPAAYSAFNSTSSAALLTISASLNFHLKSKFEFYGSQKVINPSTAIQRYLKIKLAKTWFQIGTALSSVFKGAEKVNIEP